MRYLRAERFRDFSLVDFIAEILRGTIAVDFDARESEPGSEAMRDHGTKFRVEPDLVCRLYMEKQRL